MPIGGHWRDSGRRARFGLIDAEAVIPILLFLVHITWWTFWLAVSISVFFAILNRYGYTMTIFGRVVRDFLVGRHKQARAWWSIF